MNAITDSPRKRAYLRLRPQLVERLKTDASRQHVSFNSYVEGILLDSINVSDEYSDEQLETLQKARALTTEALNDIEQKEYCSPEELKLLLYRIVDDAYTNA